MGPLARLGLWRGSEVLHLFLMQKYKLQGWLVGYMSDM